MAKGDHLRVERSTGYYHHGIDIGGGWVIHYSGEVLSKKDASVRRDRKSTFSAGDDVEVVEYDACDPPDVVVERAKSRLRELNYNIFKNNCEHFACWCKTGNHESKQIKALGTTAATTTVVRTVGVPAAKGALSLTGLAALGAAPVVAPIATTVAGIAATGYGAYKLWKKLIK